MPEGVAKHSFSGCNHQHILKHPQPQIPGYGSERE